MGRKRNNGRIGKVVVVRGGRQTGTKTKRRAGCFQEFREIQNSKITFLTMYMSQRFTQLMPFFTRWRLSAVGSRVYFYLLFIPERPATGLHPPNQMYCTVEARVKSWLHDLHSQIYIVLTVSYLILTVSHIILTISYVTLTVSYIILTVGYNYYLNSQPYYLTSWFINYYLNSQLQFLTFGLYYLNSWLDYLNSYHIILKVSCVILNVNYYLSCNSLSSKESSITLKHQKNRKRHI